ncbi:hypothetical protein [Halogranum rubrum]|uniref:Uncharacterized protein n=1 Tax=Halogranum salarium B-1 TaxID=1210908 RepID=J2ZF14_9EURY|nr:hypothetical protein [Halogranum salarium]EJN59270.1 hypothetical protein HSB1_26910 [Halogranum salarium B-1]
MEDGVSRACRDIEPVESVASYWVALDRGWQATILAFTLVAVLGLWVV